MSKALDIFEDFRRAVDPAHFSSQIGLAPDSWQSRLLRSNSRRILVNCSRQIGKSTTIGTLEGHAIIYRDGIQIINVAPGLRQSRELFRKVMSAYRLAGKPIKSRVENKLELELVNDSRVVALPGSEGTIRGFSGIDWLVFEEASRIPDALYHSVRPMIATRPDARIIVPSTPFGARGFFYEQWLETVGKKLNAAFGDIIGQTDMDGWEYFEVNAEESSLISSEFLEEERESKGDWWFQQEYMCKFQDAKGAAFRSEDIAHIVSEGVETWAL